MEYRKGKYNIMPDALSQAPTDYKPTIPVSAAIMSSYQGPSKERPISIEAMWRAQLEDPECQALYQKVVENGKVTINSKTAFTIMEDLLYWVVTLTYKTIYQLQLSASFPMQLLDLQNDMK